MIGSFAQAFPPPRTTFVALDNTLTKDGRYLLLSLYNRTGAGTGLPSVALGIVAKGSGQTDALPLASDWNSVDTISTGSGVIIPVLAPGADCIVWNGGGNPLKVYPPVGSKIDALATNAAYSLAVNKMQVFRCLSQTLIRSMQLG